MMYLEIALVYLISLFIGVINLVDTQSFPKKYKFFLHVRVHVKGIRSVSFSKNIMYLLYRWPLSGLLKIYLVLKLHLAFVVRSTSRGRKFMSLRIASIVLFTFGITLIRCYSKLNLLSNIFSKWFWEQVWGTGMPLKERWDNILRLPEKTTLWACLETSELELIFNWKTHCVISIELLFKLNLKLPRLYCER